MIESILFGVFIAWVIKEAFSAYESRKEGEL